MNKGFLIYDGRKATPLETPYQELLSSAYVGLHLQDGRVAVGSLQSGVYIFDQQHQLLSHIDRKLGLSDNVVYDLRTDKDSGLWVATDRGVSRIQVSTPLSKFDESLGLEGQIFNLTHFQDTLFAATSTGVYYLEKSPQPVFKKLNGIANITFDLLAMSDRLLIANYQGLFQLKDKEIIRLSKNSFGAAYVLAQRPNKKNHIIYGGEHGVTLARLENAQWQEFNLPLKNRKVRGLVFESDSTLWATTNNKGIARFIIPENWPDSDTTQTSVYGLESGLPYLTGTRVEKINHQVQFVIGEGISYFNSATQKFEAAPQYTNLAKAHQAKITRVIQLKENLFLTLLYVLEQGKRVMKPGIMWQENNVLYWDNTPLSSLNNQFIEGIYVAPDKTLWLGRDSGLYRYPLSQYKARSLDVNILLRHLLNGRGETMYGGASILNAPDTINYHTNRLRFEFAATYLNAPAETQYQVKLSGVDKQWSPWSKESFKDYSNLWEGEYALSVRAKTNNGEEFEAEIFQFEILAPWYRSMTAYAVYFIFAVALLRFVTQWRFRQVNRQRAILKREVKKQTKALEEAYQQLERLSVTDALTGLKNRHFVERYLEKDISKCKRDYADWLSGRKERALENADHYLYAAKKSQRNA
ncbi:two-component regulator propeller domain-containing protein [Aliikangiella maris]|uniref:Two-component regulator propeller domain-containing protein n=2 Tax=Aliikangiella maris TaxID=3162458 RepID=A0ABV3MLF0_9GAMM